MSYTVHNFTAGDIIHATDLNEMDAQIAANAEGGAVNIDDTLTIAGAAADAKKVGDEITDLKADLSEIDASMSGEAIEGKYYKFTNKANWHQGYFNASGGLVANNKNIAPTDKPFLIPANTEFIVDPGTLICAGRKYTYSDGAYTSVGNLSFTSKTIIKYDSDFYIGINFRDASNAVLDPTAFDGELYFVPAWVDVTNTLKQDVDTIETQIDGTHLKTTQGVNLFKKTRDFEGMKWFYVNNQTTKISLTPTNANGYAAIKIAIKDTESNVTLTITGNRGLYAYYFVDNEGNILARGSVTTSEAGEGKTIAIPSGATFFLGTMQSGTTWEGTMMFCYGTEALPYEDYTEHIFINDFEMAKISDLNKLSVEVSEEVEQLQEQIDTISPTHQYLKLPHKIEMIAGYPFELFYKGICDALDSDAFDFEFTFTGTPITGSQAWKRKYTATPAAADIGEHVATITVRDNKGNQVDSGAVTFTVNAVPTSPIEEQVVLCMGDSLTNSGAWPKELHRRLTGTDGSPAGFGLSNINFIGTKEASDGTRYEGYGGWTFTSYSTKNSSPAYMWITCTHGKTEDDQHSIYKDANGTQWKLETIDEGKIKIIRVSASGVLPETGTLTWVSGGTHHGDLIYTGSEQAAGNPFWNDVTGKNDFVSYAAQFGVSKIDHCIILLGWNSTGVSEAYYKQIASDFLDSLLADFPACKITLVGLQVPSRNGMASNYGVGWKYYEKLQHVWNLQEWYQELCEIYTTADYVCLSAQFDTEYNCITATQAVNLRNNQTITIQTNAVHPASAGYNEIADAVCRGIAGRI